MLKGFIKHRPKQVLAVYIESEKIQVLKASRKWRQWELDTTDTFTLPEGENLYDCLQRLNLRPRGRQTTALILFLPLAYYALHREYYPAALADRLEEALTFDWQENIFHDHEQTLHFFGPPVSVNQHLSVPIFSLQRDVYEKFHQAMGAGAFETFAVIPSALAFASFLPLLSADENRPPIDMMGRFIDPSHLEVHRYYKGQLLDSVMLDKNHDNLRLFRENLLSLGDGESENEAHINLLCTDGECSDGYVHEWRDQELSFRPHEVHDSLVSHWVKYLLNQDQIQAFDAHLLLKPWKMPKIVWPLLCAVVVFLLFAAWQVHSFSNQRELYRTLKKQNAQLETQWKPIEQLQTRISKFVEDQKTLSEFNVEGYPLLEILTVLSQETPIDTWLNYLSVRKGQLMVRGESKSAIKYLPELSKIEGFSDVRFASPVTKNPASDMERFNIQIHLDLEKFKKTIENIPPELKESSPADMEPPEEPPPVVQPSGPDKQPAPINVTTPRPAAPPAEEDEIIDDETIAEDDASGEEEIIEDDAAIEEDAGDDEIIDQPEEEEIVEEPGQ
jgi:general secretion pathway protein L